MSDNPTPTRQGTHVAAEMGISRACASKWVTQREVQVKRFWADLVVPLRRVGVGER